MKLSLPIRHATRWGLSALLASSGWLHAPLPAAWWERLDQLVDRRAYPAAELELRQALREPTFQAQWGDRAAYSLGLVLNREGAITSVLWDSASFKSGLTVGDRIVAVNGIAYEADLLKEAITAAKRGAPISLLVKDGDHYRTVAVDYRDGPRYPRLERIAGTPDRLSAIYAPRK